MRMLKIIILLTIVLPATGFADWAQQQQEQEIRDQQYRQQQYQEQFHLQQDNTSSYSATPQTQAPSGRATRTGFLKWLLGP